MDPSVKPLILLLMWMILGSRSDVIPLTFRMTFRTMGYTTVERISRRRRGYRPGFRLVGSFVLVEAGGEIVGRDGLPLGTVEFIRPYSVLAAANAVLLEEILSQLRQA
jgi:hypothetical protein